MEVKLIQRDFTSGYSGKLLPYIQARPCYISQCKLFQSHRPLSVRSRLRTAWPAFTSWTRCSSGRPCASMSTKTLSITLWTSCTHCWASAWSPSLTVSVWRKQGRVRSTHTHSQDWLRLFFILFLIVVNQHKLVWGDVIIVIILRNLILSDAAATLPC